MHKNDVHGSLMCWPVRFAHLQVQICFTFFNSGFRPYGISTTKKTQVVSSYPSRRPASPAPPFLSPISPPTAAAPFFYAAPTQVDATRSLPPACHRAHSRRSGLPALCALSSPPNASQAHRHSGQPAPSPRSPMPSRRRTAWRAPPVTTPRLHQNLAPSQTPLEIPKSRIVAALLARSRHLPPAAACTRSPGPPPPVARPYQCAR